MGSHEDPPLILVEHNSLMTHDVQLDVVIITVSELATVVHITKDENVEIIYEAPETENDIGEQRKTFDGVEDEFEKN